MAGEGAAMFVVNAEKEGASSQVLGIKTFHSQEEATVASQLNHFLEAYLPPGASIDLLLSGENGDNRFLHFYTTCEAQLGINLPVARYKHLTGEYPSASAVAVWLASRVIQTQTLPRQMLKSGVSPRKFQYILLYNHYQGLQHSFILLAQE
ncbi:MAG: hypothetical protein V4714_13665 [Bacteroidota bacterium]